MMETSSQANDTFNVVETSVKVSQCLSSDKVILLGEAAGKLPLNCDDACQTTCRIIL